MNRPTECVSQPRRACRSTRFNRGANAQGTSPSNVPPTGRATSLTLVGPATRRPALRDRSIVHASTLLLCRLVRPAGHRRRNPRTTCNGVSTLLTCPPVWPSRRASSMHSQALSEPVIAVPITTCSARSKYGWRRRWRFAGSHGEADGQCTTPRVWIAQPGLTTAP